MLTDAAGPPKVGEADAAPAGGIAPDLLFTPEERAARERKDFEDKAKKRLKCGAPVAFHAGPLPPTPGPSRHWPTHEPRWTLLWATSDARDRLSPPPTPAHREHLVDVPEAEAYEFEPMAKPFRNLMCVVDSSLRPSSACFPTGAHPAPSLRPAATRWRRSSACSASRSRGIRRSTSWSPRHADCAAAAGRDERDLPSAPLMRAPVGPSSPPQKPLETELSEAEQKRQAVRAVGMGSGVLPTGHAAMCALTPCPGGTPRRKPSSRRPRARTGARRCRTSPRRRRRSGRRTWCR